MAPLVAALVAAEFEFAIDRVIQRCPGEESCDRFRSAAGEDRQTKAANACAGCPLLPTKMGRTEGADAEQLLNEVARVRRERDSGLGIELNTISSLIWELVQLWDDRVVQHKRLRQHQIRYLLTRLVGTGQ